MPACKPNRLDAPQRPTVCALPACKATQRAHPRSPSQEAFLATLAANTASVNPPGEEISYDAVAAVVQHTDGLAFLSDSVPPRVTAAEAAANMQPAAES